MKHLSNNDFNDNRLVNVPDGALQHHAVNKGQLDTKVAKDSILYNVKDYGAVGDGVADDGPAISAALAGGNKRVYIPEGTYRLESYLRLYSNTEVIMHPSTVLQNDLRVGAVVFLNGHYANQTYASGYDGDSNITIRGGTIDCALKSAAGQINQSIGFAHGSNILIENVKFINNRDNHQVELNACKDSYIRDCYFENTEVLSPGSREFINIDHSSQAGFPHFGGWDGTPCKNITIEGCTFKNGDVAVGSHSSPGGGVYHENITVSNCTIENMESAGITPEYWIHSKVINNYIFLTGVTGIRGAATARSLISGNLIAGGCTGDAIRLFTASGRNAFECIISNNTARFITGGGIEFEGSDGLINDNMVWGTQTNTGIFVDNSSSVIVSSNLVDGFANGVRYQQVTNGAITANLVQNYLNNGVQLGWSGDTGNSNDIDITLNRLTGSANTAISIGSKSQRATRHGNRYRGGGSISDTGVNTITTSLDQG